MEGIPNDPRPHLEVYVREQKILGLLDSGASVTLFGAGSEQFVEKLDLTREVSNIRIRTADGTVHMVAECIQVPYQCEGREAWVTTHIAPSVKTPLILGRDFWNAFDIKIMIAAVEDEIDPSKHISVYEPHQLSKDERQQLNEIIATFNVAEKDKILGYTTLIEHHIDTGNQEPIKQRQYVMSPYVQEQVNSEINRMIEKDIIEPVRNPTWLNPIIPVKKSNGKIRICLDARKLNKATVKSTYPQQNANRILGLLQGTRYLTAIDLTDAFYQILLGKESRPKTAFSVSSRGTFQYKRMPMGLCNSGSTLCQLIDSVFGCELEPYAFPYLDDFIIATESFQKHMEILKKVSIKLREAQLQISRDKSRFCMCRLRYLGYVIDQNGIQPDQEKIKPILEYPIPKSVKEVRRLVGMASWYRRFICNFSEIAAPITDLIKDKTKVLKWTVEAEQSFEKLKQALVSAPILATPRYDKPFIIECDASDKGIGGVLIQEQDGVNRVIAYLSTKLTPVQQRYHVTERECLAVITSIEKFRPYIDGVRFTVITDHASLMWLQGLREPNGRLARWACRLSNYDFELTHRKGKFMVVPDALSRAIDVIEIEKLSDTGDNEYIQLKEKVERKPEDFPDYLVENDIIFKHCDDYTGQADRWKIYVPSDKRDMVLQDCHDNMLASHGGYFKTAARVKEKYYWPKLLTNVAQYIRKCDVCKAIKPSNRNQQVEMGKFRNPICPFNMLALDFVGPLPLSKRGHRQLLVVIDVFSKFVWLCPLRKATAEETVKFLKESVFLKYGVPQILITDNGPQLRSAIFLSFLREHGVEHWPTANYRPQSNCTEAANKTIFNAIRAYMDKNTHNDWDKNLSEISCAYNSSAHTVTKFSPYYILFGQEMPLFGKRNPINSQDSQDSDEIKDKIKIIRAKVAENLKMAFDNSQRKYNLRSRQFEFKVGETVWKRNTELSNAANKYSSKLAPRFVKCKILEKCGTNTYVLSDEHGKRLGKFSASDLKADVTDVCVLVW